MALDHFHVPYEPHSPVVPVEIAVVKRNEAQQSIDKDLPLQARKMFRSMFLKALRYPDMLHRLSGSEGDILKTVTWFQQAFVFTFLSDPAGFTPQQQKGADDFLLLAQELGTVRENKLMDWTVDRGEMESHDSLGATSTPEVLDVLQAWTDKVYLDKGGGDNSHIDWVAQQRPGWEYHSVGDALYYSPGKVLHCFLLPELQKDRDVLIFIRLLSVFLMHELKSEEYWQQFHFNDGLRTATINDMFLLLADVACWLASHFDVERGIYVASREFESDSLAGLNELGSGVFDRFAQLSQLLDKKVSERQKDRDLLRFYQEIFQPAFCDEIARFLFGKKDGKAAALDLRRGLPISARGFVQADFVEIPTVFSHKKFGYMRALRSDSHEDDDEYERDMRGCLQMLADGGVIHADGHRASYNRIDRTDLLVRLLREYPEGTFAAYAIVLKDAGEDKSATAFWIQKSKQGQFLPADQLAKCLDLDKYDLVPLREYANRFLIRFESEVRKLYYRIFVETYEGNRWKAKQQFAHTLIAEQISLLKQAILRVKPKIPPIEVIGVFREQIEEEAYSLAQREVTRTRIPPTYSLKGPYSAHSYKYGPSLRQIPTFED